MNIYRYGHLLRTVTLLVLSTVMLGCASTPSLTPTPNVFIKTGYPDHQVPPARKNNLLNLFYITDRAPETTRLDALTYGSNRSASMAWGEVTVQLGKEALVWDEIVKSSSASSNRNRPSLNVASINENGRFPASPYPFKLVDNHVVIDSTVMSQRNLQSIKLKNRIEDSLDQSTMKDIVLFVHGFNNSFEDASTTLAGIWHFLGRDGVPVVYSWPAAAGGLTGYFTDRESGEYTIYHLKETLRILSSIDAVENIHILAHSRGTDVSTSALRELVIETRASGRDPLTTLKIANLILAAPDLDFGVIRQRLMSEQFGPAFGQITIYTSDKDKALKFSQVLMSGLRFGRLKSTDLAHDDRNIFEQVGNVNFVKVTGSKGFVGHAYFHKNPAASSDLIQLIRHKAKPGSKLRPLRHIENNFWELKNDYLQ